MPKSQKLQKFARLKSNSKLASGKKLNQETRLQILASELITRTELSRKLGYSYKGKRDIYEILGYERNPDFESFYSLYQRAGISRRVINAPVDASWRGLPEIVEKDKKDTKFEQEWKDLVIKKKIYNKIRRADKLARIGQYSVLLMGFDDGLSLEKPVKKASELLYLQPYSEDSAEIDQIEEKTNNERYGLPNTYKVKMSNLSDIAQVMPKIVHHSRIIHIVEDLLTNNIRGEPALKCVFNNLHNIELISGGSAEMYWRGALPGLAFKAEEGAQFGSEDDLSDLEDEIQEYLLGLKRYLRLQGVDVEQLTPQVSDPTSHIAVQVEIIAGTIGMPKRILVGSERGELASSQDQVAWNRQMDERRQDFCEPVILRPLIDRLIEFGILSKPEQNTYTIKWKNQTQETEHAKSLIAKLKSDALVAYSNALTAGTIVPPEIFLSKVMGFEEDIIELIKSILGHPIGQGREEMVKTDPKQTSADPRKLASVSKTSNLEALMECRPIIGLEQPNTLIDRKEVVNAINGVEEILKKQLYSIEKLNTKETLINVKVESAPMDINIKLEQDKRTISKKMDIKRDEKGRMIGAAIMEEN